MGTTHPLPRLPLERRANGTTDAIQTVKELLDWSKRLHTHLQHMYSTLAGGVSGSLSIGGIGGTVGPVGPQGEQGVAGESDVETVELLRYRVQRIETVLTMLGIDVNEFGLVP